MLTKFNDFLRKLDEASLQGNPGLPGEEDGSSDYLNKLRREENLTASQVEAKYGHHPIAIFMDAVNKAKRIQAGHEKKLEKLAENVILKYYGSILNDVKLDIKFATAPDIQSMMSEAPDEATPVELEKLKDKKIIDEIHKRKIANNITQGEAKNVKKILNMPESVEGFKTIFGEEDGMEYLKHLNTISDIASYFDWTIPEQYQRDMWKRRDSFSGAVKIDWGNKDQDKEEDDDEFFKKLMDELSKDSKVPQEAEELFASMQPTLIARGTDYSMLIHETVKGIYELIVMSSYPSDEEATPEEREMLETVMMNTDSLFDEIEDLKYGPGIARDLRDFINKYPSHSDIDNFREKVFGKMILMEADDFLSLMCMILGDDKRAKAIVDILVKEVIDEDAAYKRAVAGNVKYEPEPTASKRTAKEVMADIDAALDARDFKEVERLSKELESLKESLTSEDILKLENITRVLESLK